MTSEEEVTIAVRNLCHPEPAEQIRCLRGLPGRDGFGSHIVAWGIAEGSRVPVDSVDGLFQVVWIGPQPEALDETV